MKKQTLILEGLSCANCANKIETAVKNLSEVESASLDFINKKLLIESRNTEEALSIIEETKIIVKRIEPKVNVIIVPEKAEKVMRKEFILDGLG